MGKPGLKGLILFLSSGAYVGYIPLASGTFGTLWGLPIFYWLSWKSIGFQVLLILGAIGLAIVVAELSESYYGRKDPSQVVIDEIVGFMVSMAGLPFSWTMAIFGFFLFRIMDILKPYPIRKIDQKMPGGWGIVFDDVLAGLYCQIILRILIVLGIL